MGKADPEEGAMKQFHHARGDSFAIIVRNHIDSGVLPDFTFMSGLFNQHFREELR